MLLEHYTNNLKARLGLIPTEMLSILHIWKSSIIMPKCTHISYLSHTEKLNLGFRLSPSAPLPRQQPEATALSSV